jgi:hypothetical protein
MMWISVNEARAKSGCCALGARRGRVWVSSCLGGALATRAERSGRPGPGSSGAATIVPGLPISTPPEYVLAALALPFSVGMLGGLLGAPRRVARPIRRCARR